MTDPAFERAFVATAYVLGARGEQLTQALAGPSPEAERLARGLGHPERQVRAQRLAAELGRLVAALDDWRLR